VTWRWHRRTATRRRRVTDRSQRARVAAMTFLRSSIARSAKPEPVRLAPRGLVPPPPTVGREDLSNGLCPMSASPRGHPVQLRVTRHPGGRRGPRRHLGGRGHRSVSRLQPREFFLIKLTGGVPSQLPAARHPAVRSFARVMVHRGRCRRCVGGRRRRGRRLRHDSGDPFPRRPPASRGHLTRWTRQTLSRMPVRAVC
jgi:hypothetical protein